MRRSYKYNNFVEEDAMTKTCLQSSFGEDSHDKSSPCRLRWKERPLTRTLLQYRFSVLERTTAMEKKNPEVHFSVFSSSLLEKKTRRRPSL
jgi:hypothetical protein